MTQQAARRIRCEVAAGEDAHASVGSYGPWDS